MNYYYEPKGPTLIELLVIIGIIGILASIVITSLNDAKSRAELNINNDGGIIINK